MQVPRDDPPTNGRGPVSPDSSALQRGLHLRTGGGSSSSDSQKTKGAGASQDNDRCKPTAAEKSPRIHQTLQRNTPHGSLLAGLIHPPQKPGKAGKLRLHISLFIAHLAELFETHCVWKSVPFRFAVAIPRRSSWQAAFTTLPRYRQVLRPRVARWSPGETSVNHLATRDGAVDGFFSVKLIFYFT